jgi:tetratricopeptide (TPR) repeat protein
LGAFIGVLALLISCVSGDEAAGDKAYAMAKRSNISGDARRTQLKTAYIFYDKAVKADTNKVSTKLRNRFLEMAIHRLKTVLDEGNINMGAIPLLMDDIEAQLKDDAQPEMRQQYAAFLVQLGDSSAARDRFIDALRHYDNAIAKSANATPFKEKRQSVVRKIAEENYEMGMMEYEMGKSDREEAESKFVRAEYFAKVALYFDSTYDKAKKLLSDTYKENRGTYSAFPMAVDDYTDTVMFRRINNFDILLAVADIKADKGGIVALINMHSNTYNPLRMMSEHFYLVDTNGKKYHAAAGQKIAPDYLDQERETQFTLRFPAVPGQIKKLVYESPSVRADKPHYTEKLFF